MIDPLDNQQLKTTQGKHLRAIEKWATEQPKVAGISILQALTYDLIQVTNQAYLRALLQAQQAAQPEEAKADG